jgi:uncharacterized membrane protein
LIGIVLLIAAAVLAVLNLKRVANLGTFWSVPPLLILGIAFVTLARRRR